MGSAKIAFKVQDRSAIVPSLDGIYAGITVVSKKGAANKPFLITSVNELIDVYGEPEPKFGTSMYSALTYLGEGNKLWVTRAAHEDATFASALVRSKIKTVTTDATQDLSRDSVIVNPIGGLTQEQLDSFAFDVYSTNKEYMLQNVQLKETAVDTKRVYVDTLGSIEAGTKISFTNLDLADLNNSETTVGEDEVTYTALEVGSVELQFEKISIDTAITVAKGVEIFKVESGALVAITGNPTVVRDASNAKTIVCKNTDYLAPGDVISIDGVEVVFNKKTVLIEDTKYIDFNDYMNIDKALKVYTVSKSEFEERDALLVSALTPGIWGNEVSIATAPSRDYDNAYTIIVYYKGVQVESWEVTNETFLDGFGNQMYVEDRINGASAYISVQHNLANEIDDVAQTPLYTSYSLWRQNSDVVYVPTVNQTSENILDSGNHKEVQCTSVDSIDVGDSIKFMLDSGVLSKSYKVASIDVPNTSLILDRPSEDIISIGSVMYFFDTANTDVAAGIVNGIQHYVIKEIGNVYYNYPMNSPFTISGVEGKLLDAGANLATGGSYGSMVTVSDLVNAVNTLANSEETPMQALMDGGWTTPAFAQACQKVAESQGMCHAFISVDPNAEDSFNYKQEIVDYKAATGLNTHLCSIFTGWVKFLDTYNQKEVWVSPESFACASQSYTSRNYEMWNPAAGWNRGKIVALDVKVKFNEGDRDWLVDNRINPIRYKKGSGLVIWGNETTLVKPSPLQLRSVSMLLIVIKYGLDALLEYKTFELNNEATWGPLETAINSFMRDEIQAKGGVYDYNLAIKDIITPSDIDNRRMPIFLGIKPTMDIKEIPVTLAIFSSGVDISI